MTDKDKLTYTYASEKTWKKIIVTEEAIEKNRHGFESAHEELLESLKYTPPEEATLREIAEEAIFVQEPVSKHIWMQRDATLSKDLWARKLMKLAIGLFIRHKQDAKLLVHLCDHKHKHEQFNTELTIMTLLLHALRLYDKQPQEKPKPGDSAHFPCPEILEERPFSFYKALDLLHKVLKEIKGPIICILGDVENLILEEHDKNAKTHRALLRSFFKELSRWVTFCIISKMVSPEKFKMLSGCNPGQWENWKIVNMQASKHGLA